MKDTFLCPGLVFRMPNGNYYRIDYVWSQACEVTDIQKNNTGVAPIDLIRTYGVLVGKNFKLKG